MVDHDSMGPSLQLVVAWISFPESCHVNSNFAECQYCRNGHISVLLEAIHDIKMIEKLLKKSVKISQSYGQK